LVVYHDIQGIVGKVIMKNMTFSGRGNFPNAWLIVGVLTLVMIGFYGAELSFSVFFKPILGHFGWTRAAVSLGMSILQGIAGLVGIMMGTLVDRYGARMIIASSALVGGLSYLLMSQVGSLWQLYLYFGIMGGICIAGGWVPINATVSRRFAEKRILALGITTSGITIGGMIMPPLVAQLVTVQGWRYAYVVLAIIVWTTAIPAIMLLRKNSPQPIGIPERNQNKQHGTRDQARKSIQSPEWLAKEAVKTVPFWMLVITGFIIAAGYYFMVTHIVAYATDIGTATTSAALIMTFMGGANILGKLSVSFITTKIGSRLTLFSLLALQAIALFLLMQASDSWMFFVLGSIFGFGFGACAPVRTSMIPEFFGMQSVGTIIGLVNAAWATGGMAGPVLAGYVFDLSQSYDAAFLIGGLLMIIGMAATYFLKAPMSRLES
jgi:MFS family permease